MMEAPLELTAAQQELRAPRAAGIAGIAFAVLFSTGLILMRSQGLAGMSDGELATWSTGSGVTAFNAGLMCIPFAGIAFLWFIAVVRDRIGGHEDRFFATVFLGSGLLFIACVFGAAALAGGVVLGAPSTRGSVLTSEMVDLATVQGYALLFVFGTKLGAVFLISTATLARRFALFGRWLPVMGYTIAAILLLAISIVDWVILLLPLWVGLLSIEILRRPLPTPGSSTD